MKSIGYVRVMIPDRPRCYSRWRWGNGDCQNEIYTDMLVFEVASLPGGPYTDCTNTTIENQWDSYGVVNVTCNLPGQYLRITRTSMDSSSSAWQKFELMEVEVFAQNDAGPSELFLLCFYVPATLSTLRS